MIKNDGDGTTIHNYNYFIPNGESPMPKPLIDRMADHVENFDCAAYADGRLIIFTGPLS